LKRTLTSIAAASMVLGTVVPVAFASSSTWNYDKTTFNIGSYSTNVSGVVAQDYGQMTQFLPVWYFQQGLKALGYTAVFNGVHHTLDITTPTGTTVVVPTTVGNDGGLAVTVNGKLVNNVPFLVQKDPSDGIMTTFVPVYYLNNILNASGLTGSYSAGTWTVTAPLAITATKQTATNVVEVDFNQAVPSGTTVTLTQNGVNYNATATWNSAKTVATLNTGYGLPAGTYTVTAGSLSKNVVISASTPTSVTIGNTTLQSIAAAPLSYSIKDQFGTDVTSSVANASLNVNAYDTTTGQPVAVSAVTNSSATLGLSGVTKGDNVVVTVTDATDAISATKTLTVVGASNVSSVALGAITDNGSANVYASDTGVKFALTAKDQYGNVLTLPAGTASPTGVLDGIQFVSSVNGVVNPDANFTIDANGNLTFAAGSTAGSATITAVVLATGQTASTTVTVASKTGVNSFKASVPNSMIVAGSANVLPYTALDSFNQPITQANFGLAEQTGVTFTSSNPAVVPNNSTANIYFDANNALNVKPIAAGSTTLYVYLNGTLQNSVTLNVNAAPYPVAISGLSNMATEFVDDATATETISAANFKFVNQYNQAYTPASTDSIALSYVSGTSGVVTLGTFGGASTLALAGANGVTGSEVVKATITSGSNVASYQFTVDAIAVSSVTGYTISAPTTLYDGASGYVGGKTAADYAGSVTVNGTDANGSVVLPAASQMPGSLTSSNTSVVGVSGTSITGVSKGTATVTAYDANGSKLASTSVTVSDAYPVATTVSMSSTTLTETSVATPYNATADAKLLVTVDDQYGVSLPLDGFFTSSNSSVATGGSALTVVGLGTTTVTYITSNGLTGQFTLTSN